MRSRARPTREYHHRVARIIVATLYERARHEMNRRLAMRSSWQASALHVNIPAQRFLEDRYLYLLDRHQSIVVHGMACADIISRMMARA